MRFYLLIFVVGLLVACEGTTSQEENRLQTQSLTGETMGTTFSVTYLDSTGKDMAPLLQKLLVDFNQSVSTYIDDSEISTFNQQDSLTITVDGHFYRNYQLSKRVYNQTEGWFNPSVMPLVNYWGFGYTEKRMVQQTDSAKVDSLLQLVQFDSLLFIQQDSVVVLKKHKSGVELDFSAIAKGDAVDEVGRLLKENGISNYFVEIGGEIRARGTTVKGFDWRTGIRRPTKGSKELQKIIELRNQSLATSGNYENYHEDVSTGIKYAHTINPHTGYPEKNRLLSVSVFANNCATADAFATAFMAMGLEKALAIVKQQEELEAYFIYSDETGKLQEKMTAGVAAMVKQ